MSIHKFLVLFTVLFIFCFYGCKHTKGTKNNLPKRLKGINNLAVYPANTVAPDTILLSESNVFKSSKGNFIDGLIGDIAVDDHNRVYIAAEKPHASQSIYVFRPNGQFIRKIGQLGKGPGEFLIIAAMKIRHHKLYVYDSIQQRFSIFSLKNFNLIDDYLIRRDSINNREELASWHPGKRTFIQKDGIVLEGFTSNRHTNNHPKINFFHISGKGEIDPHKVLTLKRHYIYNISMKRTVDGHPMLPLQCHSPKAH